MHKNKWQIESGKWQVSGPAVGNYKSSLNLHCTEQTIKLLKYKFIFI